jgi:molybdate-binding protein/DNA-binding transcriptional regulator YhcF (GntR family)
MQDRESFLYLEIAESIRRLIASGDLAPGDRLPTVRQMAKRWECTPGTVSRAYSLLASEGLIEAHRGSGTRVKDSTLRPNRPIWQWASLVNRADQFLLQALSSGHTPDEAEAALSLAIARWRDLHDRGVPSQPVPPEHTLRFVGSHDMIVESLARMLAESQTDFELTIEYAGSLGGLIALAQRRAEIAGTHLWDESTDTYNAPFVKRLLPGRRVVLLTLVHRSMGLMLPPDNPLHIHGLADLTKPEVLLVNRQPGSGTRVWLDAQLKALGITPATVPGYQREEVTHLAVARAIADGEANVGLGIDAASAAYGLAFVPLTHERYDLAMPESVWKTPAAQTLVALIRSSHFQEHIAASGGYDTSSTGQEHWIT